MVAGPAFLPAVLKDCSSPPVGERGERRPKKGLKEMGLRRTKTLERTHRNFKQRQNLFVLLFACVVYSSLPSRLFKYSVATVK